MVREAYRCDRTRLGRLLDGELPTAEQDRVVEHLSDCPDCCRAIEELAAAAPWWGDLRGLAGAAAGDLPTAVWSDTGFLAPPEAPGEIGRFGPYPVTGVLGRGGMGVVLLAYDLTLHRPVAVKVLSPRVATSPPARGRFAREARAAAAVVNDHVVAIHAVAEWEGLPYLVMPYEPGGSLQDRIDRQGALGVAEVLRIGMQAASGLAAAHAQGLVHRDVKPSNILLGAGVERAKLTDFGLARAADDASLTQTGVVAGTPDYMSPEQARGEAIDPRADLFSLGSVLYAMCTGRPPFRAPTALAVLRRVTDDRPRPVREVNPDVPDYLAGVIEKLHAKDPAGRFQSAAEVADLLGRCLAHARQPLAVPPPAVPGVPVARTTRPRRRAAVAGLVAAALVVLGVSVPSWRTSGTDPDGAAAPPVPAAVGPGAVDPGARELDRGLPQLRRAADDLERNLGGLPETPPDELARDLERLRGRAGALERELARPVGK